MERIRRWGCRVRLIADHQSLYQRCTLQFSVDPIQAKKPTDLRLAALSEDQHDPGLGALMFHYGRFLLIASSRENGNPANLQGLWNPHIEAPWNIDYHLNFNLQMNYQDLTGEIFATGDTVSKADLPIAGTA